jgi:hypothetical protein
MDGTTKLGPEAELIGEARERPRLLIRAGRGRTGGSTGLDLAVQRARNQGRRVKPLDGDLRSRTLSALYPTQDDKGKPIRDGASSPKTDELPDIKEWLSAELDSMVEEHVSRVLDLSGGDRVMQEYVRDLALMDFCRDFGIDAVVAVYLGPDMEDFRHATQLLVSGEFRCERTMLVLNEGVIRQGQTTAGAFDPILQHPDFEMLKVEGARVAFMRRLTCMSVLKDRNLRFYDVLATKGDAMGPKVSPTLFHMTKTWLDTFEREWSEFGVAEWLP